MADDLKAPEGGWPDRLVEMLCMAVDCRPSDARAILDRAVMGGLDDAAVSVTRKTMERLEDMTRDCDDLRRVAGSIIPIWRCKGGRLTNSPRGPYTCMICGADVDAGDECRSPVTPTDSGGKVQLNKSR